MKQILNTRVRSISVVTVCLNTRGTIRLTMESVARQTFPDVRHVIIDGGSNDGTLDIIREYNPRYLVSEKDDGIYHAMDKGARAADGDLLIFLNAGDTFFDETVCEKVAKFADKEQADIVFGDLLPVRISPSDHSDHSAFNEGKVLNLGYMRNRKYLYNESIHHQTTFYRRWIFNDCSYLCEEEHASGEYNLLLNAVQKRGAKVQYIPQTISRFALGGTSTKNFEKEWEKYSKARETLRKIYMPDFDAIKIKGENEFHAKGTSAPLKTAIQRIKTGIKKGPVFGLYSRLANGIAGRTTNTITPELRQVISAEVRAALGEAIERFDASEDRQIKKWASFEEVMNQSIDKIGLEISTQNEKLISLESSIQQRLEEPEPGRKRHEVLVQHGINKIDTALNKTALTIARLAEAAGLFDREFGSGFSAYSQWDEDGVLQYLIRKLKIENKVFVEFGVGDYQEANTRLLLVKDGWSGLVIDSDTDKLTLLKNSEVAWRFPLNIHEAMIEPDNIDDILVSHGIAGKIGLLSIDIDGMDYWVWSAIEAIQPSIVVCEYNSLWGSEHVVTVPYERGFDRTRAHSSWTYAGASIGALRLLGKEKGYELVTVNDGGNNAFFVREELLKQHGIAGDAAAYQPAKFREARNAEGALAFSSTAELIEQLEQLELYDLHAEALVKIKDLKIS